MTHQIKFKEVVLDVKGTYYSGSYGTHEAPPEPEEFEIDKIELNGTDVTDLLECYIDDLEIEIINNKYR